MDKINPEMIEDTIQVAFWRADSIYKATVVKCAKHDILKGEKTFEWFLVAGWENETPTHIVEKISEIAAADIMIKFMVECTGRVARHDQENGTFVVMVDSYNEPLMRKLAFKAGHNFPPVTEMVQAIVSAGKVEDSPVAQKIAEVYNIVTMRTSDTLGYLAGRMTEAKHVDIVPVQFNDDKRCVVLDIDGEENDSPTS